MAGRNFDKDKPAGADTSQPVSIIVNETASKIFGFDNPAAAINKMVIGAGFHCKIVGVMNDYHQQSLEYNFDPIVYYPEQHINMTSFSLKLHTTNLPQVLEQSKKTWSAVFPQSPLQFFFLDEYFNRQYNNDKLFSTILWWFTILSIIVASLGLFGLSLYTVVKRTKEISIRKVLGASAIQIIGSCYKRLHKTYFDRRRCLRCRLPSLIKKLVKRLCISYSNRPLVFSFTVDAHRCDRFDHRFVPIDKSGYGKPCEIVKNGMNNE